MSDWRDVEATILDILNIDSFEGCTYIADPNSELGKFMMSLVTVNKQNDLNEYLKALNNAESAFTFLPNSLTT